MSDEFVRYCPECGTIGPVDPAAGTCCPDSFGMQVRRWQAEKMDRMLGRLRGALAAERERCARIVEPSADADVRPQDYRGGAECVELLHELAEKIRKG